MQFPRTAHNLSKSCAAIAIILFILLDAGLRMASNIVCLDPYSSPNRSWIWWAVRNYRKLPDKPDLILMGSSLMMAVVHGSDADYLQKAQSVALHNRCLYFEHLLASKEYSHLKTFAFAIGGQMASDAYVLSRTIFTGNQHPKTIIYGIAPRDFIDNTLSRPESTETFRYMTKIGHIDELNWQLRKSIWEKADFMFSHLSFLYGHKADFTAIEVSICRQLVCRALNIHDFDSLHTPPEIKQIAMLELPEDNGANDFIVFPDNPHHWAYRNNLDEYKRRYASFKADVFNTQMSYLEKLLHYCRSQGIQMILVNMPLTRQNVQLLPPGSYNIYLNRVGNLASRYGSTFIDLDRANLFAQTDFSDSVHLNGIGGQKFFSYLSHDLDRKASLAQSKTSVTR